MIRSFPPHPNPLPPGEREGHSSPQQSWGVFWHIFIKVGGEAAVIPESVLAECVYVLLKVYKIDRQIISEKLRGLFAYKGIVNPDKKDL